MASLLPNHRWLPYAFLLVSFLGFLDASYLTQKHYSQTVIPCSITHGCETVTNSVYSQVAGIPVALLGALFYLAVFLGTFAAMESGNRRLFGWVAKFTLAGLLASAWFVFAQLVLIKAICQWCMASVLTSTTLFILGYAVTPKALTSPPTPDHQQKNHPDVRRDPERPSAFF
ncbi:vitamin K epoxide reductase family protein [Candidatus Uhrbacteria bacterium]|nr:vitamin K epoxide reductase family protein [Candidatus Uhrbacteria bacterium]